MGTIMRGGLVVSLLFALGAVVSCGGDEDEEMSSAEVVIPLTAQGQDGTTYRLEADFVINGELYSALLPEESNRLSVAVPAGVGFEVRLLNGWTLYRQTGATWNSVAAVLLSPNLVNMVLDWGESAIVTFVFGVGDESLELAGGGDEPTVGVEIEIDEVAGGLGLCPEGRFCVAGNGVFTMSTMSEPVQEHWVPFAISFDFFEEASMPNEFSTGAMTLHFDLESTPGLSPEQAMFLEQLTGVYDQQTTCGSWMPGEWDFGARRMKEGGEQGWNVRASFPAVVDSMGRPMLVTSSGSLMISDFYGGPLGAMIHNSVAPTPKTAFFVEP